MGGRECVVGWEDGGWEVESMWWEDGGWEVESVWWEGGNRLADVVGGNRVGAWGERSSGGMGLVGVWRRDGEWVGASN